MGGKSGGYSIQCDKCNYIEDLEVRGFGNLGLGLDRAEERGWLLTKSDTDFRHYCPTCAKILRPSKTHV